MKYRISRRYPIFKYSRLRHQTTMTKLLDRQLKKNDCGISAVKTVCNILDVNITRDIIEDDIYLDEEGSSLGSLNKFFNEYGFNTEYKLFDLNAVNGNQTELSKIFPCIVPVKGKRGLHYVVVNGLKNYKFKVLDPAKSKPYEITIDEFKKKALYNSASLDFVDVEESLNFQVNQLLRDYNITLTTPPTQRELTEIFNKIAYFSYVEEKYGFKNKEAGRAFLNDLLFNQELKHIPKHFEEVIYKNKKVKIKAPIFLSIKKTEQTKEAVGSSMGNVYWNLFKTIGSIQTLWYIFLFSAVLGSFISYISVFINQILIDHILPSHQMNMLNAFAVGVGIFFLIETAFKIYKKFVSIHLSIAFDRYFMKVFDEKLTNFSIRYLQGYKRGDLTERLRDSLKLKSFFTKYFSSILVDLLIAMSSMIFLFMINWKLSMLVLVVLFLFTGLFYFFTPIIENLERERYTKKADFTSKFIEKIDGIQTIKALGLEKYSSQIINAGIEDLITVQTKSKYVALLNSVLTSSIKAFASLALLILTSREMIEFNTITLGMIITFLALSNRIFSAFSNLLDKNLTIQEHKVILNRFFEFNEKKSSNDEVLNNKKSTLATAPQNQLSYNQIRNFEFESLSLSGVNFSYNSEDNILKNINFNISKNKKVLIQGKNGSGKSTLCKVLGLLYEPTHGEVLLNEIDASMYDKKRLRKKVVFVSGEDILFNETLIFNIAFGRKIDMEKLIEYAKVLDIYKFVQKKADKFEFIIYENGKNLSTGQRKKILLLRALMTESELVILDEIFNGMDKESKRMAESLLNFINDRAFIVISHMPSERIFFDKTYEIKNGILLDKNTK